MAQVNISEFKKERIRKTIGETIEIYNPNESEMDTLVDFLKKYFIEKESNPHAVDIDGLTVIKEILPVVSNILIDTMSDEELKEIVNNPTFELELAFDEVGEIMKEVMHRFIKGIETISKLTPDDIAKMLKFDEINITDEEVEQLKALKKKAEKAGMQI